MHTRSLLAWMAAACCWAVPARAEYGYFSDVPSGSDIVMKEVRWPYWNSAYYNTWWSQYWTSSDGVSGYWYNGLALPAAGSPNPVGTKQTVNWSFWPLSSPINITDTITPFYSSPPTFAMPTIGEGTILRSPGKWSLWQTNVWYRMVLRTWQPVSGTPHLGYAGSWMRDPVAGVWYHLASVQLPFSVTGIDGSMSFQENAVGGAGPQRTDYRRSYYHRNGAWNSSTQWYAYNHGGGVENVGLIETNTAVYYETCKSNGVYVGTITNAGQQSPTLTITQPATPAFDPIIVASANATVYGNQLLVQWQVPATSSPQFAYQINVYTNAGLTGNVVASFYDIAPEAQQKLLSFPAGMTPYPQLTIIDIFNQTNTPITITPTLGALSAAGSVPGAVNGLSFAYYQSATSYTTDASTNWSSLPNFASLTPISIGAVSGVDLTPRQRRNGYAFNYTGYLNVPSDGLYAFTLNSCDGSKLFVDGQLIINGDGKHSPADASGWIGLQSGFHAINVQYFFDTQPTSLFSDYFDTLTLSYEGPGISRTVVPPSAFYRVPGGSEPSVSLASPTNGATLSNASVPLSAVVTPNGNTVNRVQFYVGNYYWGQDASAPYSLNSFFWASPNNAVRARLIYGGTNLVDSGVNLITTTNMPLTPWQYTQAFYHNEPNGVRLQGGTYSLLGDGVNLLTRQVSGDCTLTAHLAGITTTAAAPDGSSANTGWQAGIILRGSTAMVPGYPWGYSGSAPFTAVFGQVDGGAYYQNETMVNGGGGYSSGNLGGQKWFRIQRVGSVFTSSVSADGTTWTPVQTNTLSDFGTVLNAGFFTYAGPSSNPNIHWASFDNVSLAGNLLGPPGVSVNPAMATLYAGQNVTLTATPSGNAPFAYQWQCNNVNLPGATNATLTLTNVQPAASGLYTMQLANSNGTASATSTLSVLTPPAPVAAILSNNPVAYWRLNEAVGPTAYDSAGSFHGTAEGGLVFGVPGATNGVFAGFEPGNLAAQFNGVDSDIAIPALNLNTNAVTMTGWVKRSGVQTAWSGILFCRSGSTTSGLHFGTANELRYTWNNSSSTYNWSSTLVPPDGVWTFVALTISPSQAVIYMATNGTLQAATNIVANAAQAFAGTTYLGYDPNSSSRRINGVLDEVAIYNHTLTAAQIGQVLAASQSSAPAVSLTSPVTGAGFAAPAVISLGAGVTTNGHTITSVSFYSGSILLGQAAAAPFTCTWTNVPVGAYTLYAEVTYDAGSMVSSLPAFVTVNPFPSAPASITPTALSGNLISITWPTTTYASGYILSRNGAAIAYLSGTNYLDLGLSPGTPYAYSVVATNVYGASLPSVTNSVTTPGSGVARWWDAGGSTTGAQDGNGNWGNSANTWWNGSTSVTWADNSLALIGSGTTTNCAVTITNSVTPSGLLFNGNNGGAYTLAGGASGVLVLSGTPSITCNDNATLGVAISGSGQLTKSGPGLLTITGGNSNTGPIVVNGGKLVATGGGWYANRGIGSGALTVNGGALAEFTVAHGFGADNYGRSATLNNGTLQFDHENYVSSLSMTAGTVSGAGEVRTTGGTYSTLASANPSVISLNVNFVSAGTFNVARGTAAVDLLASGPASGAGNFTKTGAGIMAISGAWANTGTTTVSGGTLQVDGSLATNMVVVGNTATLAGLGTLNGAVTVQSGGALSPGDAGLGKLTFANTLSLSAGSKTVLELSKTNSVLTNDEVVVTGALTLGGTLTVTNISTNALVVGDSFTLFNAGSFSGNFSAKTLPGLTTNLVWDTSRLITNGLITVVSIPVITNQPKSLAVNPGSPASFAVGATGTGTLSYQWQKNGTNLPGATTNLYALASATTNDAANYTVVITNSFGSVTSAVAMLTVSVPPAITSRAMLPGGFQLSFTASPGQLFSVRGTNFLGAPLSTWPVLTNGTVGAGGSVTFTDAAASTNAQQYYGITSP